MRLDAPSLEKQVPISTAISPSTLIEIDAAADELSETRSQFVRNAVQARLADIRAGKAA